MPIGWRTTRLKFVVEVDPIERGEGLDDDSAVSFLPMEAIGEQGAVDLSRTRSLSTVRDGYTGCRNGDVVVAKITPCFENGKGAVLSGLENGVGFGTTELFVLRPSPAVDGRFLYYLTASDAFRKPAAAQMYGAGGQKRVPPQFVGDFTAALPSISRQRATADFLDRETANIALLIDRHKQLLELKEKQRCIAISEAVRGGVRGGLRSRASNKDLPSLWRVMRLKHACASIRDGTHAPPPRAPGVHRLLSVRNMIDGELVPLDDDRTMSADAFFELQRSYTVEPEDVLLAIVGATTGKSALMPTLSNVTVQRSVAILRPDRSRVLPRFLHYCVQSDLVQGPIAMTFDEYSAQPGIYLGDLGELRILVPPLDRQLQIVSALDAERSTFEAAVPLIRRQQQLLQDYRSALINAAVTS